MTYTEVPWYPAQTPGVQPEIHAPIPTYPQPETTYALETQVPHTYQWPSQNSQTGFPTFNPYHPGQGFCAYQPPYGVPGFPTFGTYQSAHGGFTAFRSSHHGHGHTEAGSSSSPYQAGHHMGDSGGDNSDDFIRAAVEDFNFCRNPDGIRRNPERAARSRPWPEYTPPLISCVLWHISQDYCIMAFSRDYCSMAY